MEIIKKILKDKSLTIKGLSEQTKVGTSILYQISMGAKPISNRVANLIKIRYPEYNIQWILGESEYIYEDETKYIKLNRVELLDRIDKLMRELEDLKRLI